MGDLFFVLTGVDQEVAVLPAAALPASSINQHPAWRLPCLAGQVIEMYQSITAASDIWSVGCLVVEALTGAPPYFDLQPMSALFRIVADQHPPLPGAASPLLQSFLMQCFKKVRRLDAL